MPAQARYVGDLQEPHDIAAVIGHDQEVTRVSVDGGERSLVGVIDGDVVAGPAEHVIGQQADDRREVSPGRLAEDHATTLCSGLAGTRSTGSTRGLLRDTLSLPQLVVMGRVTYEATTLVAAVPLVHMNHTGHS